MNREGVTLVEVLLAMAIFLFGMVAVMGLFHFGGDMENKARVHAELAPAIEPLVAEVRDRAWRLAETGGVAGLRELRGEPVPGAADYRYDLLVDEAGDDPDLRGATLRFYRSDPDRPLTQVRLLLPRRVPVDRRFRAQ